MARPLASAVAVVDRVAAGDLTVRVEVVLARRDRAPPRWACAQMRDGLAEAVSLIRSSAETVGTASKQIAAGHADLSSAHRGAGREPRGDRLLHGGARHHGAAERRQRARGQRARLRARPSTAAGAAR